MCVWIGPFLHKLWPAIRCGTNRSASRVKYVADRIVAQRIQVVLLGSLTQVGTQITEIADLARAMGPILIEIAFSQDPDGMTKLVLITLRRVSSRCWLPTTKLKGNSLPPIQASASGCTLPARLLQIP